MEEKRLLPSVFDFPYIKYYILISVIWGIIGYIVFTITKEEKKTLINSKITFLYSISIIGLSIGLIAGNSRNSISDIVVSSVLTIVGGLVSYSFVKQHMTKENTIVLEDLKSENIFYASFIGLAISISVMYGIQIGSQIRVDNDEIELKKEFKFLEKKLELENKYKFQKEKRDSIEQRIHDK